jgi:hypothetical protein
LWEAKQHGGHDLYTQSRAPGVNIDTANTLKLQQQQLYDKAWEKVLATSSVSKAGTHMEKTGYVYIDDEGVLVRRPREGHWYEWWTKTGWERAPQMVQETAGYGHVITEEEARVMERMLRDTY